MSNFDRIQALQSSSNWIKKKVVVSRICTFRIDPSFEQNISQTEIHKWQTIDQQTRSINIEYIEYRITKMNSAQFQNRPTLDPGAILGSEIRQLWSEGDPYPYFDEFGEMCWGLWNICGSNLGYCFIEFGKNDSKSTSWSWSHKHNT